MPQMSQLRYLGFLFKLILILMKLESLMNGSHSKLFIQHDVLMGFKSFKKSYFKNHFKSRTLNFEIFLKQNFPLSVSQKCPYRAIRTATG